MPSSGEEDLRAIGDALRERRERRGEDLYAVADYLRIKPAYLYAVEEGDFSAMPARAYALGFLRSYARHLELDAEKVVEHVKEALDDSEGEIDYRPPARSGAGPAIGLAVASMAIVLAVFVGARASGFDWRASITGFPSQFKAFVDGEELAEASAAELIDEPPAPELDAARGDADAAAPALDVAAAGDGASAAVSDGADGPIVDPLTVEPAAGPSASEASPLPMLAGEVVTPAIGYDLRIGDWRERPGVAREIGPAGSDLAIAAAPGDGTRGRVSLIAREASWVKIYDPAEEFVREATLAPGETVFLPDRADLALWTGNAGGIEVVLDGKPLGALGDRSQVIRDISLSPNDLERRFVSGD